MRKRLLTGGLLLLLFTSSVCMAGEEGKVNQADSCVSPAGADCFGAIGISVGLAQEALVTHNSLFFCHCGKEGNTWNNNTLVGNGTPPEEVLEAIQTKAGLEPVYRRLCAKALFAAEIHKLAGDKGNNK